MKAIKMFLLFVIACWTPSCMEEEPLCIAAPLEPSAISIAQAAYTPAIRPAQQALQRAQQVALNAKQATQAADEALAASQNLLTEIEKATVQLVADDKARRIRDEEVYYTVSNKNFVVGAVGRSFSEAILAKAEQFRREHALANGIDLDDGDQLIIIHVMLSDDVDRGFTLLGDKRRGLAHRIWLTTNRKGSLDKTLSDQILNVVLFAQVGK